MKNQNLTAGQIQHATSKEWFNKHIGIDTVKFIEVHNVIRDFDHDDEYDEYTINFKGESLTTNGKKWWTGFSLSVYGKRYDSFIELIGFTKSPQYLSDLKSINSKPIILA